MTPARTLMPGLYDLRFSKIEWRFIKVDGGKTTELKLVQVKLARGLNWQKARVTTQDGKEVFRFDAVTHQAVLPPGDYVVEIDGNAIPFPAAEGRNSKSSRSEPNAAALGYDRLRWNRVTISSQS